MDKKKLKKIWNKYKLPIVVVVLLVVFVIISTLVGDHMEKSEVDEWLEETKKEQYVVTVISRTTCHNCVSFKPKMEEAQEEYGFKLYWHEYDKVSEAANNKMVNAYDLTKHGFEWATPYYFVTYNGEYITSDAGDCPKEDLIEFLKNSGVIKEG